MKRERPICRYCGSENLIFDACARWNSDTQSYQLIDTYDSPPTCQDCEQEGHADWQDMPAELQ